MTHEFDKHYWERHWHGRAEASTDPGPAIAHLARETLTLEPGTALDAGCGTGAAALWLAGQGWRVTAADISSEALAVAADRAAGSRASESVRWVEADLTAWEPDTRFDLVTTHYAHPATSQLAFYERIAEWVAPGGTLLVVGHLRGNHHVAEAAVTVAAVTALLPTADWEVVTAEESNGDVVVRAVRRPAPVEIVIDDPRRRRSILVAVCVALMAVIASVSGLNVAQPELAVAFDASQGDVLWFINIYTISLAALLLPLGALGDRWGRKPVLLTGLAVFGVANAAAGLATSSEVLLASRLVSGVGAAMIMPVTLAVITSSFPDAERSKAIGAWAAVAGGGGILGMYLSAVLVDLASWRWLFVLPVVLVVVAAVMAVRSVPNSREAAEDPLDALGSLLSVVAVLGLIFVLHEGPEQGWTAPGTLLPLMVGVVATVGFVSWELRHAAPLLDVRLFRQRGLGSGSVTLLTVFGVLAGIFVVLFPFFQAVLGWSGLRSTVALMPMALLMMAASGLAPWVSMRIGGRATMASGILLAGGGLALMATFVSMEGGYRSVLPGMVAMGLGMGLSMTPATEAITSSLPRGSQGVASALNDVTRELGTALGVALLGAVLSAGYRGAINDRLDGATGSSADAAREGVANAVEAADGSGRGAALVRAAQESFVDGWQQAMWAGFAAMAMLFVFIVLRGPEVSRGPRSRSSRWARPARPARSTAPRR